MLSLIIALLSGAWAGWNSIQIAQNEARAAITQDGVDSLKAANEKLEEQGLDPIPLPREGEAIDADALAAAAAALAYNQMKNDPTFQGPQGVPGATGKPGEGGKPGAEGKPGSEGARGQDGEDAPPVTAEQLAQAVAAYCSQASQPCTGDQGPAGRDGVNGADGADGRDGPSVFTFTVPGNGLSPDRNYVCSPDPPDSTNFVCQEQE